MKFHDEFVPQIEMRRATEEHAELILAWRNTAVAREFSRNSEILSLEDHLVWLRSKLDRNSPDLIFIFYHADSPIGMTRLDFISLGCYEISVIIDETLSGQGLGRKLVHRTCEFAKQNLDGNRIIATIKEGNQASLRLFSSLNFSCVREDDEFITYELRF